jgi:hypothetical protein
MAEQYIHTQMRAARLRAKVLARLGKNPEELLQSSLQAEALTKLVSPDDYSEDRLHNIRLIQQASHAVLNHIIASPETDIARVIQAAEMVATADEAASPGNLIKNYLP